MVFIHNIYLYAENEHEMRIGGRRGGRNGRMPININNTYIIMKRLQ